MELQEHQVRRILDVILRLGEVLLASQAGTADVAASIAAVTAAYGLPDAQVDVTAGSITVSVPRGVPNAPLTAMWLVGSRSLDYTRLYDATQLAQRMLDERPDLAEVEAELERLSASGHPYPRWVSTLALGIMASALSLLLGAGGLVVLVAGITTALIDRVGRVLNRGRVPLLFQQVVAAGLATGVTIGLDAIGRVPAGEGPSLVVAANIAVLLSGMATVGSMQDAITGYYLTATSRGVEILLSSVGILIGVTIAVRVGLATGVDLSVSPVIPVALVNVATRVAAGAVGAAAAAVAGYAPLRAAAVAGAAGAAGTLLFLGAGLAGADPVSSSFVAAIVIGLAGTVGARRLRIPPLLIAMAGIVPLVPGLSLYRGFVSLLTGQYAAGFDSLVTAAGTALALGGGVVLGPLLAPSIRRELAHLSLPRAERRTHPHRPRITRRRAGPTLAGIGAAGPGPDPETRPGGGADPG